MPRSFRTDELEFDPEIEKTARRLRKETKQHKKEASTSSKPAADSELDVSTSNNSKDEVMAQNLERTIKEMTSFDLNQQPLYVEYPNLNADFELKSGLIHLLPTFRGLAGEDPYKHLKQFHVVCSGMRPQGVTEEQVKLRAFPFTLGDKAKDWFYSLPSGSIVSWNELKKLFLENYFPASRTTNIRKKISGMCQFSSERLSEANRSLVDASSGGALYDKTPTEARKLITTMAANNQQFGSRNDSSPQRVNEVSTSIDERLDKLTFLVENFIGEAFNKSRLVGYVHLWVIAPTLVLHFKKNQPEHANAVGGIFGQQQRRHDPFSNTYNPGWRDHPNLRYDNQRQNFQRVPQQQPPPPPPQTNPNNGMSLEDIVKTLALNTQQFQQETHKFQQETRSSIQNLESQMSQLASSVSRLESQGKFSSQTIINPNQNVSAITLCSGKELQLENGTRRGYAQQDKTEDALEILPKQAEKSNLVSEESPKVFIPKPPFPERFAKSKEEEEEEEEKDILETLLNVELNILLLDAIKQIPRYAKFLKELCANKSKLRDNERVSMGENVSAIFQRKLPPKCNDPGVVLQLADHSVVYPKGVLEDVLVQVNELSVGHLVTGLMEKAVEKLGKTLVLTEVEEDELIIQQGD
ncbi:uncharacterized protein LOC105165924 [Sesamum indicum]|uniref:Uncharacterized protein LOC105165924 n=1 Tax=Sesamum indicum TaxID=4182 RepID=A0A8M8V459_SESIN|nr:uncharacterized protein LOC105165924 [Sesamum indicum]